MAFEPLLNLALGLLIIGNGFFKPNISAMVGNLYEKGDPRRDAGFNIFYVGINIGSFVAFVASAWVKESYGWFWTFRMAGIGLMLLGIFLFAVEIAWFIARPLWSEAKVWFERREQTPPARRFALGAAIAATGRDQPSHRAPVHRRGEGELPRDRLENNRPRFRVGAHLGDAGGAPEGAAASAPARRRPGGSGPCR